MILIGSCVVSNLLSFLLPIICRADRCTMIGSKIQLIGYSARLYSRSNKCIENHIVDRYDLMLNIEVRIFDIILKIDSMFGDFFFKRYENNFLRVSN